MSKAKEIAGRIEALEIQTKGAIAEAKNLRDEALVLTNFHDGYMMRSVSINPKDLHVTFEQGHGDNVDFDPEFALEVGRFLVAMLAEKEGR